MKRKLSDLTDKELIEYREEYSQCLKISSRLESIRQHGGVDVKALYHLVRLSLECIQILETRNMVLDQDKDLYKYIRAGNMSLGDVYAMFEENRQKINRLEGSSSIPDYIDKVKIKQILMDCLETQYGDISKFLKTDTSKNEEIIRQIRELVQ